MNCSTTRANKADVQIKYCKARTRRIQKASQENRTDFLDDLTRMADEAAGKNDVKECYVIRRILKSVTKITDRLPEPVAEICSPTKRSSEHGGQSTSGGCSVFFCQVQYQTKNQPAHLSHICKSMRTSHVKQILREPSDILKSGRPAGRDGKPSRQI